MNSTPQINPSGSGHTAAVVLAAGFSSRMGTLKPLLSFGEQTALERVVASLRTAGVARVVVVTGHDAERVSPLVERLGAVPAHNPAYGSGMFSSVRAGVAALPGDTEAFFVLPVDCPLVTPRALGLVLRRFAAGDAGVVYPTCLGHRGHPPLISSRYIRPLLATGPEDSLQAFLAGHAGEAAEVDVSDLTVLMDMDTPSDYRSLVKFASALDAAESSGPEPSLTSEDSLYLLAAAGTPPNIVRHCRTAATVGVAVAEALKPHLPALDVDLVRAGCLLHDIARLFPHHATLAAALLTDLGLPRLGAVVGEHMVIDPKFPAAPAITEAELVYLADKTVTEGEIVGLDERLARTVRKMRPSSEIAQRIAERIADGRTIAAKVGAVLGQPLEETLRGVELPREAQVRTMRVYLARHARPEGPEDRRYRGQADLPLGAAGRERAHGLAGSLMTLTGGACFDAVFASDLSRCLETAEIAAGADGCTSPVRTEPGLREIDVGLWEDLTWEEAKQRFPAEHAAREADLTSAPFPGGESFAGLRDRVLPAFERLLASSLAAGHRRVLVVAHKGVNRVILAHLQGIPLSHIFSIEQDYCAVTLLKVDRAEDGSPIVTCAVPSTPPAPRRSRTNPH
jgi:molybdenum cofactor cytidylyltransferase